jgi:hypothetical protein
MRGNRARVSREKRRGKERNWCRIVKEMKGKGSPDLESPVADGGLGAALLPAFRSGGDQTGLPLE